MGGWLDLVNRILGSWDRATVHAVVLTAVVLVSLFLVNTRAAYYFVLALVSPREIPETSKDPPDFLPAQPPPPEPASVPEPVAALAAAVAAAVGQVTSSRDAAGGAPSTNGKGDGSASPDGGGLA